MKQNLREYLKWFFWENRSKAFHYRKDIISILKSNGVPILGRDGAELEGSLAEKAVNKILNEESGPGGNIKKVEKGRGIFQWTDVPNPVVEKEVKVLKPADPAPQAKTYESPIEEDFAAWIAHITDKIANSGARWHENQIRDDYRNFFRHVRNKEFNSNEGRAWFMAVNEGRRGTKVEMWYRKEGPSGRTSSETYFQVAGGPPFPAGWDRYFPPEQVIPPIVLRSKRAEVRIVK
jgi:hypothetical protein